MCPQKFFLKLEGLDEQFEVAYEDVDFAYRAKLAGANFLFVREAQACHPWRSVRQGGKIGKRKIMNPQTSCVLLKSTIQVNRSFLLWTFSEFMQDGNN